MSNASEIHECLDATARNLQTYVGQGKALGVVEVAETLGVSDGTVYGRTHGRTTGQMTLEEFARLITTYRDRFPEMTDKALDHLCRLGRGHFVRDGAEDHAFLDANGDGRADHRDIPNHAKEVVTSMVDECLEGDQTPTTTRRETARGRCLKVRRHARAIERLARA